MKNIVITGVSSGIGLGLTRVFAKQGYRVFGSVRKIDHAGKIKEELGDQFYPIIFDVTDRNAIKGAASHVAEVVGDDSITALVNNAGISVNGPLMHLPIDDFRHQMEVNVIGQLAVTQAFLPLLGARKGFTGEPGRIVMMSSLAGKIAFPFIGAYVSSKHALEGLSDSLRRELQLYNIDVIILEPGPIHTEIWYKVDETELEKSRLTDFAGPVERFGKLFIEEGKKGWHVDKFSDEVYNIVTSKNPKTRYVLTPNRFKSYTLPSILPDRMIDNAVAKQLGLKKE